MEKIRREIKLFWTRNGKSLLQILGFIAVVILIVQTLNQYAKDRNDEETSKIDYELIEKEQIQLEKQEEHKQVILTFIDYCNSKKLVQAYEMLSEECKQNKYDTVEDFEQKYVKKIFNNPKDCDISLKENNIYKIIFLKDLLQAGTIENREEFEDYYSIQEDVLGNKTININLYNNV